MIFSSFVTTAILLLPTSVVLSAPIDGTQPIELPQLTSLADQMVALNIIPNGALLILLSANSGWPGMYPSVNMIGGSMDDIMSFISERADEYFYYGISAEYLSNNTRILILAPAPICVPMGLPTGTFPGENVSFHIEDFDNLCEPEIALLRADMNITELYPDSFGNISFITDSVGIYWLEVMHNTDAGPSVALLLPVICGGDIYDVISGNISLSGAGEAPTSKEDILSELNILRVAQGSPPLIESPLLDSIARIRSIELALSGSFEHYGDSGNGIIGLLPDSIPTAENIARGSGYNETWEMLLISPFHLRACLAPYFVYFGSGAAVDSQPFEWQLVYVQVFAGEEEESYAE